MLSRNNFAVHIRYSASKTSHIIDGAPADGDENQRANRETQLAIATSMFTPCFATIAAWPYLTWPHFNLRFAAKSAAAPANKNREETLKLRDYEQAMNKQ